MDTRIGAVEDRLATTLETKVGALDSKLDAQLAGVKFKLYITHLDLNNETFQDTCLGFTRVKRA
jgi:hypothetical protein